MCLTLWNSFNIMILHIASMWFFKIMYHAGLHDGDSITSCININQVFEFVSVIVEMNN